jgi:hypothetical protein
MAKISKEERRGQPSIPKDLGVKFGTKTQAKWEKVKDQAEASIDSAKLEIEISKAILALAEGKIAEEKKTL